MAVIANVRVRTIHECEVTVGKLRVRPDSAVLFALLLYLTVRAGERVLRDEVLELFWGGDHDAARRHALRQLIYRVRRDGLVIDTTSGEIGLQSATVDSDLGKILTPSWAHEVPLRDVPMPASILPMYRPSHSRAYSAWLESVRTSAAAQIRRAALRHVAAARSEGRWEDAETAARLCLAADPLNEEGTLALAESAAMNGAKAEALRILDAYLWDLGDRSKTIGLPARLLRRRISEQPASRTARGRDPALVGRATELAWLNEQLSLTERTTPRAALVAGAPGIGKSAVIRSFIAHAEIRGWRAIDARMQPSDAVRAMSLFVELVPRLLNAPGAMGAAPESIAQLRQLVERDFRDEALAGLSQEPEAVRARILFALRDMISAIAHESPLILVLEDLHWIDPDSMRAVAWLLDTSVDTEVFCVLSSRLEGAFSTLCDALTLDRVPLRIMPALDAESSGSLFIAYSSAANRVPDAAATARAFAVTGGNPLYIRELAGHLRDPGGGEQIPANLRALIRSRVGRLSAKARRLLNCSAVLGRFATVERVSAVLEVPAADLLASTEELDGVGLLGLNGEPGSLALHDVWQEELSMGLGPAARAVLHLRAGEVLGREAAQSRAAVTVIAAADHFLSAGTADRALALLESAAGYQLQNGFAHDAVLTSRQALQVAKAELDVARIRALHLQALQSVGGWEEIIALESTLAAAILRGDAFHVSRTGVEFQVLEALWKTGRGAREAALASLAIANNRSVSNAARVRACLLAAQAAGNLFDRDAMARVRELLALLPDGVSTATTAGLMAQVVVETEIGSIPRAIERADALIARERHGPNAYALVQALRFAAYPQRASGATERALALASEAFDLSTANQFSELAAQSADVCASIHFEAGKLEEAERWAAYAEKWAAKTALSYSQRSVRLLTIAIALAKGDVSTAGTMLQQLDIDPRRATLRDDLALVALRVRVLEQSGQVGLLKPLLDDLEQRLLVSRSQVRQDDYVVAFVRGLRAVGLPAKAAEYARQYRSKWRRDTSRLPSELQA